MPEIGPDASSTPLQWRDAFAALPMEAAQPQAWERLRARLPAQPAHARRRWPLRLATAASLLLVAIIPLRLWQGDPQHRSRADAPQTAVEAPSRPAPVDTRMAATPPDRNADAMPAASKESESTVPDSRLRGNDGKKKAVALEKRRLAGSPTTHVPRIAGSHHRAPLQSDLESLYAESARLEALLAIARDDHLASSGAAALTDSLDAELATIDAELIESSLDAPRRAALWQQRVDTLRQLAGIETTRRLLSARGETYDVALVGID